MRSYHAAIFFAGGVGITHQLSYVRDLVIGFNNGTVAAQKIVLIWIIQSPTHIEWVRSWLTEVLEMDTEKVLQVKIFITQPCVTDIYNPQTAIRVVLGRPNVDAILKTFLQKQVGFMGVSVCGPGPLSDDVRQAVLKVQYDYRVDFIEASFS
jgi:ferredoxin-NADP reductase